MNKTIIMTLAAALMLPAMANEEQTPAPCGTSACEQQQPSRPGPRFSPEQRKAFIEKFDADKDGKLSDEERKAAHEAMKKAHGQRGERGDKGPRGPRPEGAEGRPEGRPGNAEGRPGPRFSPEQRKAFIEKFDTDKDGQLSEEERKAAHEAVKKAHGQRGDRGPRAGKHGRPGAPEGAPAPEEAPAPAPEAAPAPADSVAE